MFNHNTITYIPENIGEKNDYLRLFKNYTITNNNTQVVNGVVSLRMGTTKKRYDYRVGYIDPTTDGTTYSIQLYSSVAGYLNMIAPWEQIGTSDLWKTSGYVNTGDYIEMVIDKSIITGKISSTLEISDRCFYTLSTVEDKSFRLFDLDNPLMLSNQDKLRAIRGIKVYSAEYQYYYVIRALQALTNTATLVVEVYNIDTDEKFGEITFRSADVRLNKNGIGYINANIANGDYLEFIIDYNRVNAGLNAWGGQKLRISPIGKEL